jgi:two-component sensor histidine kinase
MQNLLQALTSSNFMPHGQCFYWRPDLIALHVVGDGVTALSYYVIPAALIVFVYQRSKLHDDVRFGWIFVMFAGFILACGTTHLISVWTLWVPHYWLSGFAKLITAGISVTTAWMLWPLIPRAVNLPSQAELEAANSALQVEVTMRRQREDELERLNAELDRLNVENLERRRFAEEAQLYSEASLTALYDALPDAILQTNADDVIIRAKDPQVFEVADGKTLASVVGQSLASALAILDSTVTTKFMAFYQQVKVAGSMQTLEYKLLHTDQNAREVYREARAMPLGVGGCVILIRDISDRKRAMVALEQAVADKVVLLRELHHRVKNNLQVIASMLSLQASSAPNTAARDLLKESYRRVHVMSDVHRQFYDVQRSDDQEQNIKDYLHNLIDQLTMTLSNTGSKAGSKAGSNTVKDSDTDNDLEVLFAIEDVVVPLDQIVPLGLIANELLTNVFKYAFPAEFSARRPMLWVALTVQAEQLCFLMRDNGIGLAESARAESSSSLGMSIVQALAGQLGGRAVVHDVSEPAPSDMPQLAVPAALAGSPGTVAQLCVPYRSRSNNATVEQ